MKIAVERVMMEMISKLKKFHLAVTDSTWSVVVRRISQLELVTEVNNVNQLTRTEDMSDSPV